MLKLNLDHSTKVIDTCCGTGGFLIAAMQEMKKKANSKDQLKKILSQNLIGCEDMPDMFTLSVGNMILRGDGKSNLYQGDSFDKNLKESLKKHKPKYGLTNPPFAQKDEDLHELSYVLNMLEILEPDGIGVVLPMGITNPSTINTNTKTILCLQSCHYQINYLGPNRMEHVWLFLKLIQHIRIILKHGLPIVKMMVFTLKDTEEETILIIDGLILKKNGSIHILIEK